MARNSGDLFGCGQDVRELVLLDDLSGRSFKLVVSPLLDGQRLPLRLIEVLPLDELLARPFASSLAAGSGASGRPMCRETTARRSIWRSVLVGTLRRAAESGDCPLPSVLSDQ